MSTLMLITINAGMSLVVVGLSAVGARVARGLTPPHLGGPRRWRGPSTASKLIIPIQT